MFDYQVFYACVHVYYYYTCTCSGSVEATEMLVDAGADVNTKGCNGSTPLILAANGGHSSIAKFLLQHPNINIHEVVFRYMYYNVL